MARKVLKRYAAIDLGTNTCLLLVAAWDGQSLLPLAQEMEVVRLGEGVDRKGLLSEATMNRAVAAFRRFQGIIERHNCRRVSCIATSDFREAANGQELQRRLASATGYRLEAISGRQEAQLVYRVTTLDFPMPAGRRVIADIGGGSTELILEHDGRLAGIESLPLGTVRLTERWFRHDPPSARELDAAQADIRRVLETTPPTTPIRSLVGVGGTATTFVAMAQVHDRYDHSKLHGATLTRSQVVEALARCQAIGLQERRELPGLHPGRADVIIAGGLILQALMVQYGLSEVLVSDKGVRWGAVMEMVMGKG